MAVRNAGPGSREKLYRRALAGKARVLGDDHPDLAVTPHNLGLLLAALLA